MESESKMKERRKKEINKERKKECREGKQAGRKTKVRKEEREK